MKILVACEESQEVCKAFRAKVLPRMKFGNGQSQSQYSIITTKLISVAVVCIAPLASYLNYAYLCKYYPDNFSFMVEKMRETETMRERESGIIAKTIATKEGQRINENFIRVSS
jgi:hypothetical protein